MAAALVATAAALKDSKRAHALAADAADELTKLSKSSSKTGSAMWQLALQVGRQSLEALLDGGKADGDGERDRKQAVASKSPPKAQKVSAKRGKASDAA